MAKVWNQEDPPPHYLLLNLWNKKLSRDQEQGVGWKQFPCQQQTCQVPAFLHTCDTPYLGIWTVQQHRQPNSYQTGRVGSMGTASRYGACNSVDRIPMLARFSTPVQTGTGTHPASCTTGNGSLAPWKKRMGRVVNHPPPYTAEVKARVQLHHYSPSRPSWHVLGWNLPVFIL